MREKTFHSWQPYSLSIKAEASDQGVFSGYASTYNLDLQNDRIAPGAFAQSIKDRKGNVPIFRNHDPSDWIGFSTALAEDGKGLAMTGKLAMGVASAQDAYQLLRAAADIDFRVGMSIGFDALEWEYDDAREIRTIKQISLAEISLTPFPAQPKAFVSDVKTWRDFERRLREVDGFSKSDAKRVLNALAEDFNWLPGGRHGNDRHQKFLAALSDPRGGE